MPRSKASMPTQASSEFITNKQQGDWAENVIFRAVNDNSRSIVAVRYGKSDDLVAGDVGFEKFYKSYQAELDLIGKRPDLLLLRKKTLMLIWGMTLVLCLMQKLQIMYLKLLLELKFVLVHFGR